LSEKPYAEPIFEAKANKTVVGRAVIVYDIVLQRNRTIEAGVVEK